MTVLEWQYDGPTNDPFETSVGVIVEYQLHYAKCYAEEDKDIRDAVVDTVHKSISFAPTEVTDSAARLVFLWDEVYAFLTVVYTDDSMEIDCPQVTKCMFKTIGEHIISLDFNDDDDCMKWQQAATAISNRIRSILEDVLLTIDLGVLPSKMPIYFSDQDRASCGTDFVAHQLTRNGFLTQVF